MRWERQSAEKTCEAETAECGEVRRECSLWKKGFDFMRKGCYIKRVEIKGTIEK